MKAPSSWSIPRACCTGFSNAATLPALFLVLLMGTVAAAQTARIEIHSFETVTLTDHQFLIGAKDGTPARIGGELRLPVGTGRFPAVILVHGSYGVGPGVDRWAQEFNSIGVAAFLVDSFTGRGIVQTASDQSQLGHLAMIVDAYRALEVLSKHPRIDATRIAVMGFSKGGFVALYASLKRFQRMHGPAGVEFAAYIPFYPSCSVPLLEDDQVSDRPIRLFHGTADDWSFIEPCRQYVARLRRAGKDVQLTEYAGAQHAFDYVNLPPGRPQSRPDGQNPVHCIREEQPGGQVINRETGQPFTWTDACVQRGATIGYDPHATTEATKAVKAFLTSTFKLTS
jgi:dienelactone hydrolase